MRVIAISARLDWLIANSGISSLSQYRRLNAIENQLIYLARAWRPIRPIDVANELRMSAVTRDALLAWVETSEPPSHGVAERLEVYRFSEVVLSDGARDGWISVTDGSLRGGRSRGFGCKEVNPVF